MHRKQLLKKYEENDILLHTSYLESIPPTDLSPMTVFRKFYFLGRLGRYQEAIDSINVAMEAGTVDEHGLLLKATALELMGRLG
jgi:hypothetical protein